MKPLAVRTLLARGQLDRIAGRGPSALPAVRAALWDPDWKLRRNALRILDHLADAEALPRMIELLGDEREDVRKWAAHSLGCDRCKPNEGPGADPVPFLIETALRDPSVDVRRSAVVCLAWNRPADARIHAFLSELADSTDDPKLRRHARDGAIRHGAAAP